MLGALAHEIRSSAWLVLVTRRDHPGGLALGDEAHPRIELSPLSPEDVQRIALATPEAEQLPPHVVELAVERSGGALSSCSTCWRQPRPGIARSYRKA